MTINPENRAAPKLLETPHKAAPQTLGQLVPPSRKEISNVGEDPDAIRRAVATLSPPQSPSVLAAHDLDEYSRRTAPRFPIPHGKINMAGLASPGELREALAVEEQAEFDTRRRALMQRIRSAWSEIQSTIEDTEGLEDTRIDGVPVAQAVERLMTLARASEEYSFVIGQAENETTLENLEEIVAKLEKILKELDACQKRENLLMRSQFLAEVREQTEGRPLTQYSDRELIGLWKDTQPEDRIPMIWKQMDLLEKCLKEIEELGGTDEMVVVLEPVRAKVLAIENSSVRDRILARLNSILSGTSRDRDNERWLQSHYLGYHEVLAKIEQWLPQLKTRRRAERRARQTENKA